MRLLQTNLLPAAAVQEVQDQGERGRYGLQVSPLSGHLLLRVQLSATASTRPLQSVQSASEQEETPGTANGSHLPEPGYAHSPDAGQAGAVDPVPVVIRSACACSITGAVADERERPVVEHICLLQYGDPRE